MDSFIYPTSEKYENHREDINAHYHGRLNYDDEVTDVHEGTHGINADLRNANAGFGCFYVLNDMAIRVKNVNCTLRKLARAIPRSERGDIYQLYLVEQARWWNDTPLYICDEWVSYLNGTRQACFIKDVSRAQYSLKCTKEMLGYMKTLSSLIDDKEYDQFLEYAIHKTWFVEEHEFNKE